MKIIKKILLSMFAVLSFTLFTGVANAACGKITIANMNWASANFMAEVEIGRAHVRTPVTEKSRMPSSA